MAGKEKVKLANINKKKKYFLRDNSIVASR